ncbi:LLM class flavin-dependent oxidoreductase [Microbacterium betulae]|uniref:LLM class flavin-dependent oxidoreductase n=1 Tax=Microbacterium betulae TaxID=2981139 RepID=A0AA97FFW9_9MICO|nr:LLM class flavin-dependent oxidoreductase [Microbacterium sp. AB]WOF22736.1 LLM class flavin-dependent oxidoreductase [Microbacterium sp. AB]
MTQPARPVDIGVLVPVGHAPGEEFEDWAGSVRRWEDLGVTALVVEDDGAGDVTALEPLTLLSALATATERIGLVASVPADGEAAYAFARKIASLDHLSAGRAGWRLVASRTVAGGWVTPSDGDRAAYADEVVEAVRGLWDTVADDAFPRDQESGVFLDRRGRRTLDHRGTHVVTSGPINVSRPPQGHPVLVQTAASADELSAAARRADVVVVDDAAVATGLDAALAAHGRARETVRAWRRVPGAAPPDTLVERVAAETLDGVLLAFDDVRTADGALSRLLPLLRERGLAGSRGSGTLRAALSLPRPALAIADMEADA